MAGSKVIHPRGVLDLARLPKQKPPKHISMVRVTLKVLSGTVKDLVMDLIFMGLDIIRLEDKSVCFVHPKNSSQTAKKCQDMPAKFQKVHEDLAEFDQDITRFKNDIKEGRKRTYTLSIWLGSKKPPQQILDTCALEWEEEQANGGSVKIAYKRVQSLHTSRNLMLIGVLTDMDSEALQIKMHEKMEEACHRMLTCNPSKYGTNVRVPQFVLEKDFIKNMPYAELSNEDDIPFWACMPFHLECEAVDEDHLKQILAYMYRAKCFEALFGEATFYYNNPGLDASAGERSTLVGIYMRHIAMVRLMGHFVIKGLVCPDCRFPLTKFYDDEPDKVSILVDCLVRELMMKKKIHGTTAWILIAQTQDGCWVGHYRFGVGNDGHKKLALEWSGSLSVHIRLHLLGRGFDNAEINNLIKGSFDLQATKDAAQAVVGEDGRVKSIQQAEAEQVLFNHDKT